STRLHCRSDPCGSPSGDGASHVPCANMCLARTGNGKTDLAPIYLAIYLPGCPKIYHWYIGKGETNARRILRHEGFWSQLRSRWTRKSARSLGVRALHGRFLGVRWSTGSRLEVQSGAHLRAGRPQVCDPAPARRKAATRLRD